MAEKINKSELEYANFMDLALNNGVSLTDMKIAVGNVFEAAYRLKIKEEELRGVFFALEKMVHKEKKSIYLDTKSYNQAIDDAASKVFPLVSRINITPEHTESIKESILKLKK